LKESRETQRIPILLTVGKLEPFKADEAKRVRADAYIVKPFEASELLTALTRLEDKIVPEAEPRKPGRFAKAAPAVEHPPDQEYGDSESGWKNRIKFPSGKKKVEPERELPASEVAQLRERAAEAAKALASPANESRESSAHAIPAGIPADVTPEEIAAITAAAAQLSAAAGAMVEVESKSEPAPSAEEASSHQEPATAQAVATEPAAAAPQADVRAEAQSEAKVEVKAEVQNEVQSAVQPEAQPDSKSDAHGGTEAD